MLSDQPITINPILLFIIIFYIFSMNKPLYKLQDIFYSALWSQVKKYAPTRWMGVWSEKRVQEGRTKLDY